MKKSKVLLFSMAASLLLIPGEFVNAEEVDTEPVNTEISEVDEPQEGEPETMKLDTEDPGVPVLLSDEPLDSEPAPATASAETGGIDTSKYENTDVCDFVVRMYEQFLDRQPDPDGLDYWYNKLVNHEAEGANIVDGFVSSTEFEEKQLSTDEFLDIMYAGILDRQPDSVGRDTWTETLSYGVSRKYISAQFVGSDEFNELCSSYNITQGHIDLTENRDKNPTVTRFVTHFYQNCLDRQGDPIGLNTWTGGLLDQTLTGTNIADGFIFSDEFQKKNLSNEEFIKVLYATILSRKADANGLTDWSTRMENGVSQHYITTNFIYSNEFTELCDAYQIKKGDPVLTENRDQNYEMTSFITGLYRKVWKQTPSAENLNDWTGKLLNYELTSDELANAFFQSKAYTDRGTSDTEYITDLYTALLNRQPSAKEIETQLKVLSAAGGDRQVLLDTVSHSDEYREICSAAGISLVKNGWCTQNGNTYYFENGVKKTGWLRLDGKRYYLNPEYDGARQTNGWQYVDGYQLYFNENGELVQNVESLIGPQDSYMIKVYKWGNYAIVFAKDSNGNYNLPVKAMITSCGNNTPTGDYWSPYKYRWLTMVGGSKAQWCTQILGSYLFHSVPYRIQDNSTLYTDLMYNYLGTTQSLGCIRLQAGDAKWIYDNCSLGTHISIDPNVNEGPFDKPAFEKLPSWHTWDPTDPTAHYLCEQHGCH